MQWRQNHTNIDKFTKKHIFSVITCLNIITTRGQCHQNPINWSVLYPVYIFKIQVHTQFHHQVHPIKVFPFKLHQNGTRSAKSYQRVNGSECRITWAITMVAKMYSCIIKPSRLTTKATTITENVLCNNMTHWYSTLSYPTTFLCFILTTP